MDISAMVNQMSQQATRSAQEAQSKMSGGVNDPEKMMKAQFAMQQYSSFVNMESAVIKTMKDMIQGIISKM
ncbi:type III secretion system needle protein SsaG [Shewanella sp. VB17]|uniref:type III secretion system needle filament subunit SctF n=1 Tax=Shewanella sp. VB17 TaxID=2739432 RepID=UPI0015657240|nr:type III secretion system needle filament subunit SctF [Shewanella sp. VB17]NRD74519.1 type III secretion system needle protein SsaG [Shewanella sp. VB17]